MKEKIALFKNKGNLIHNALSNIDNKAASNRIVFGDDIESEVKGSSKKPRLLFDDDEKDEEPEDLSECFNVDKPEKLAKMQTVIGNDSRFTLDDRFVEEKTEENDKEDVDTGTLKEEKEWQLNILGDLLGKPIKTVNQESERKITKKMVRYNPLESQHHEYEIIPPKVEPKKKKKKRTNSATETEEAVPEVSKDMFYKLSTNLTETLKQDGEFSLLKAYGRDTTDPTEETVQETTEAKRDMPMKSGSSRNPFKYDSSESEDEVEVPVETKADFDGQSSRDDSQRFFFVPDDSRFQDAFNFFKKQSENDNDFANLRRELKQIVRAKIRNNVSKTSWNKKRKIKKV